MRVFLYMLSVQRRLSVYMDSPLTVILQACARPLVMYCQQYQTRYLYCLLPGQPQVNRLVFGRQLFASHCLCVGGFLARWSDNSSLKHMTLTRTVVHCMGSGPCQGRLCKSWGRQENLPVCEVVLVAETCVILAISLGVNPHPPDKVIYYYFYNVKKILLMPLP